MVLIDVFDRKWHVKETLRSVGHLRKRRRNEGIVGGGVGGRQTDRRTDAERDRTIRLVFTEAGDTG